MEKAQEHPAKSGGGKTTDHVTDRNRRKITFTPIKSSPLVSETSVQREKTFKSSIVTIPSVIVPVGLPARGKSFISNKLCRYLKWSGIRTKVFNLGDIRRTVSDGHYQGNDFFEPGNEHTAQIRQKCAEIAMDELTQYLNSGEGEVAIFDATNTTRERRQFLLDVCTVKNCFRVFFVESICNDPKIVEQNIQDVKVNGPDYRGMDPEEARRDFEKRIKQYEKVYEQLDIDVDNELSFIQVIDAGRSFFVHNIVASRSIYLCLHGESEFNKAGKLRQFSFVCCGKNTDQKRRRSGGDSELTSHGNHTVRALRKLFLEENARDLSVWSSQRAAAVQTANNLRGVATFVEHWRALNDIDAGDCDGLTSVEFKERFPKQFALRNADRYHYRYPLGEELEKKENVLVISHRSVLRCLLAYFLDKNTDELPRLDVPFESVIKLTPVAYGCKMDVIPLDGCDANLHHESPTGRPKSCSKVS